MRAMRCLLKAVAWDFACSTGTQKSDIMPSSGTKTSTCYDACMLLMKALLSVVAKMKMKDRSCPIGTTCLASPILHAAVWLHVKTPRSGLYIDIKISFDTTMSVIYVRTWCVPFVLTSSLFHTLPAAAAHAPLLNRPNERTRGKQCSARYTTPESRALAGGGASHVHRVPFAPRGRLWSMLQRHAICLLRLR